ncbi:MAG: alpha-L-fucosidase [Sedimentisphaerales bacterium]|nr:alpha-L-fucosidase [Sedimentisphaerales bacterium]
MNTSSNENPISGIEITERQKQPDMAWWRDSMQNRDQRIAWWHQARFGMFIHWGAYSQAGGEWKGQPVSGYAEHMMRKCKIPREVYLKEVVSSFNPIQYNPAEWVSMAKAAGMGYIVITSKHHDGFAMYDSKVSDYDIVDATPYGKDILAQLRDECLKQGIKFGVYYSHAFDWEHPDAPGNDWDYQNPGGDLGLFGGRDWYKQHPEMVPRIQNYVDNKSIPQVRELIRNYHPSIIWFDTPSKLPPSEVLRVLKAVREETLDTVVNSRIGGDGGNYGDYRSTADRPAEFAPVKEFDWEGIPTTNESYGYSKHDHSHKPAGHFIQLLAKAVSRGGNLMMNIGPMGNGQFAPEDIAILNSIADWMKYYKHTVIGMERSPLPVQNWGAVTCKYNTLYLHVFDWPADRKLIFGGLKNQVSSVHLLDHDRQVELATKRLNQMDVEISLPEQAPDTADSVIKMIVQGKPAVSESRLLLTNTPVNRLHVFDSNKHDGIRFKDGKKNNDCTIGWRGPDAVIAWNIRVHEPSKFEIRLLSVESQSLEAYEGTYELAIDQQIFSGPVNRKNAYTNVGKISLKPGEYVVAIRPLKAEGDELVALRGIEMLPIR